MEKSIKVVSLLNGMFLIGEVEPLYNKGDGWFVEDVVAIQGGQPDAAGGVRIGFAPWPPFVDEKSKERIILEPNSVIAVYDPSKQLKDGYRQTIQKLKSSLILPNGPKVLTE